MKTYYTKTKFSCYDPIFDRFLFEIIKKNFFNFNVKKYNLFTHDIDKINYVESLHGLLKTIIGDILKRNMFYPQRIVHFFTKRNAHCQLDWLLNVKTDHIFMILNSISSIDSDYNIEDLLLNNSNVFERKHVLPGFHYSYNSIHDYEILQREFNELQMLYGKIDFCRGHYLRTSSITNSFCNENDLIDLTPTNREGIGFYLPSSYPVYMFNQKSENGCFIINTHYMDVSLHFTDLTFDEKLTKFLTVLDAVHTYGGIFTLNWHNTSRYWGRWPLDKFNYQYVCNLLK